MLAGRSFDVVAVGHAIVDVLAPTTDDVVASLGLAKGTMTLVDAERAEAIYGSLGAATKASGGSAANTCAGLASLGADAAFVGKVADDELGHEFTTDIRAAGVAYDVPPGRGGPGTGRCLVLVTPDAERTMCTNLGIGDHLGAGDIDAGLVAGARILYLEGYLCGLDSTRATIAAAVDAAGAGGTEVALSLSDPAWVAMHKDALTEVMGRCSIVFANEAEAMGITGAPDGEGALKALGDTVPTAVVTRGAGGCLVAVDGEILAVPAEAVDAVDTTGAGDLFAAGFLYGHLRAAGPEVAARLGALAAGEVITHFGARPRASLASLAACRGLLG